MGLFDFLAGSGWNGEDGEDTMTEQQKDIRAGQQARGAIFGGDPFASSPDEDGHATGGCYNGDYPDSWHEKCNERLNNDEYYEAETEKSIWSLFRADNKRREAEDDD